MTGKRVSLYTDNQSIIDALLPHKATPGQYLINTLRIAVNALRCRLEISGHSKVKGNEAVDQLAKGATAGHSSALVNLPHILRTPLPISASAIKQSFMSSLKFTWKECLTLSSKNSTVWRHIPLHGLPETTKATDP